MIFQGKIYQSRVFYAYFFEALIATLKDTINLYPEAMAKCLAAKMFQAIMQEKDDEDSYIPDSSRRYTARRNHSKAKAKAKAKAKSMQQRVQPVQKKKATEESKS